MTNREIMKSLLASFKRSLEVSDSSIFVDAQLALYHEAGDNIHRFSLIENEAFRIYSVVAPHYSKADIKKLGFISSYPALSEAGIDCKATNSPLYKDFMTASIRFVERPKPSQLDTFPKSYTPIGLSQSKDLYKIPNDAPQEQYMREIINFVSGYFSYVENIVVPFDGLDDLMNSPDFANAIPKIIAILGKSQRMIIKSPAKRQKLYDKLREHKDDVRAAFDTFEIMSLDGKPKVQSDIRGLLSTAEERIMGLDSTGRYIKNTEFLHDRTDSPVVMEDLEQFHVRLVAALAAEEDVLDPESSLAKGEIERFQEPLWLSKTSTKNLMRNKVYYALFAFPEIIPDFLNAKLSSEAIVLANKACMNMRSDFNCHTGEDNSIAGQSSESNFVGGMFSHSLGKKQKQRLKHIEAILAAPDRIEARKSPKGLKDCAHLESVQTFKKTWLDQVVGAKSMDEVREVSKCLGYFRDSNVDFLTDCCDPKKYGTSDPVIALMKHAKAEAFDHLCLNYGNGYHEAPLIPVNEASTDHLIALLTALAAPSGRRSFDFIYGDRGLNDNRIQRLFALADSSDEVSPDLVAAAVCNTHGLDLFTLAGSMKKHFMSNEWYVRHYVSDHDKHFISSESAFEYIEETLKLAQSLGREDVTRNTLTAFFGRDKMATYDVRQELSDILSPRMM